MKSWNEIRKNAAAFSKRWKTAHDEKSQAQSFLKEFFAVFDIDAVQVATFEHRVKFSDGSQGYVDCFWQGKILVEMKSRGKDLDAAFNQAMEYVRSLPDISHTPRAIVVSDFQRIRFYNLEKDCALSEFSLKDLRKYVTLFGFLVGLEEISEIQEQDPVNRKAAEKMANLHDAMKETGYFGHPLEVYLVRLLFCLFAEDTGIFKPAQFTQFISWKTSDNGSDLAPQLALLFDTLNRQTRLSNLDETVAAFPYINGGLFAENLPMAAFSSEMRKALLDCATLDWSKISPAIFGSMFQGVMDEKSRHDLGAHYTSEENILKLIKPLFLDALRSEFAAICSLKGKMRSVRLGEFHEKIAKLTFLDPACGCGNFLLIAYRELRRLEMDILEEMYKDDGGQFLDISQLCKVSVSQFYGIEIEAFPCEIAKVALWLMDHLCNMEVADRFGQYFVRIPIKASAHIVCDNALKMDWGSLLVRSDGVESDGVNSPTFSYIMGNPPFLGAMRILEEQKHDMESVFGKNQKMLGELDFVTAWFKKAADFIQGTTTRCAFVATNSITQGQQVPALWRSLNVDIDFAYRTFKWKNAAKGVAAVHCVIIGFSFNTETQSLRGTEKGKLLSLRGDSEIGSLGEVSKTPNLQDSKTPSNESNRSVPHCLCASVLKTKRIFDGDKVVEAENINPYLMDAPSVFIESRPDPLYSVPSMNFGNMPRDGGNLIIEADEYERFIEQEPQAKPFIRPLLGAEEFLHGKKRYCLWLVNADLTLLRNCPKILERVEKCRQMRLSSKAAATRKFAATPGLFCQITQPEGKDYILIPCVSSERRDYVPIGFLTAETIVTNLVQIIPDATLYHFGILTSRMHNAWMRAVAGRLKSDYRYSKDIVYNNFIWPEVENVANVKMLPIANANCQLGNRELGMGNGKLKLENGTGNIGNTGNIKKSLSESQSLCASVLKEYSEKSPNLQNSKSPSNESNINNSVVKNITQAAQAVLDARAAHPGATLADLYDPRMMPPNLVKAHAALDALVDKAYGLKPTCTDAERVAHLFKLYADRIVC